ncbi:MAG: hypothetical protein Ct9H300mP1_18250 [Planctomycetaceae bacterium]|nr:MAG: hypothetical protein Ct9H300mP1_18250 [Planctomycetaceae bacterium]
MIPQRATCISGPFRRHRQILRKDDPLKQNVLQLSVFDNDHPETELHRRGWPSRWAGVDRNLDDPRAVAGWAEWAPGSGWTQSDDGRSFTWVLEKTVLAQVPPLRARTRNVGDPKEKIGRGPASADHRLLRLQLLRVPRGPDSTRTATGSVT